MIPRQDPVFYFIINIQGKAGRLLWLNETKVRLRLHRPDALMWNEIVFSFTARRQTGASVSCTPGAESCMGSSGADGGVLSFRMFNDRPKFSCWFLIHKDHLKQLWKLNVNFLVQKLKATSREYSVRTREVVEIFRYSRSLPSTFYFLPSLLPCWSWLIWTPGP